MIHFKTTPHPVFSQNAPENKLIIRIQPDEAISMRFGLKKPGAGFEAKEVSMDFRYADLADDQVLTAYERLLLDAMKGDATLFARTDAVHAAWNLCNRFWITKNRVVESTNMKRALGDLLQPKNSLRKVVAYGVNQAVKMKKKV